MTKESIEQDLKALRIDRSPAFARREPGPRWRIYLAIFLLVIFIVGAYAVYVRTSAGGKEVEVAIASRQDGRSSQAILTASGYVIAREKIAVSTKIPGRIKSLEVRKSDRVRKGQLIARLEDDEIQAQVRQAQANLEAARARLRELEAGSRPQEIEHAKAAVQQAEANLKTAELNLRESEQLFKNGIISKHQLDQARNQYDIGLAAQKAANESYDVTRIGPRQEQIDLARAQVRQAQASLQNALAQLDNTVIRAPIDGVILDRLAERGELLSPGLMSERGAKPALVTMADTKDLQVELDISESDINKVKLEQAAWIVPDAYPDRTYHGVLEEVAPEANRQKATIQVKVKVQDPDDHLRPEMSAKVTFLQAPQAATERSRVLVPKAAVLQRDGHAVVFLAKESRAVSRPVTVGGEYSGYIEILQGLQGGEAVVVKGQEELKEGHKIVVR